MRLTFDPENNVAYIHLHPKTEQVETIRVSEEMNVDLAPDGTIYGIELLNANEQLAGEDGGVLIVIDEARGKLAEVDLGLGSRG
jgi:uncharacterized protein YuzE